MAKEITYLNKALSSDEKILGVAEYHWVIYAKPVLCFLFALFGITAGSVLLLARMATISWIAVGVVLLLFVYACLARMKTEFVVTNRRVLQKFGIISIVTEELNNGRIESISLSQSILGRILGYGNIYFSGTGTTKVIFPTIKDPLSTKSKFSEAIGQSS